MTSKAELIAQAVVAALTMPAMSAVPSARVVRDLHGLLEAATLPSIAVETGDESEPSWQTMRHKARLVDIEVTVVAQGASPFTAADPALVESYNRIMADRTLGGLAQDVLEGPTRRDRTSAERQLGAITKTYRVQYRTGEASLES